MVRRPVPGKNGNKYVPYDERTGEESVVFFTRDLYNVFWGRNKKK